MTFQKLSLAAACFVAMVFVSPLADAQIIRTRGVVRNVTAIQPASKGYEMQVALTSNERKESAWTKTHGDATLADKSEPVGSDDDAVVVYKLKDTLATFHFAIPEEDYEITTDFVINPKKGTVNLVSSGSIGMSWDVAKADGIAVSKRVVASPPRGTVGGSTTHEWKFVAMSRKQDDASITFVFNWRGRELATVIVRVADIP